jgi:hypothetical protein
MSIASSDTPSEFVQPISERVTKRIQYANSAAKIIRETSYQIRETVRNLLEGAAIYEIIESVYAA